MAMKILVILFLFGIILGFSGWASGVGKSGLTLVQEGKPTSCIVLTKEPTRVAQFAAYELQYHLKLITGAEIPIVMDDAEIKGVRILVGESKYTKDAGLESGKFQSQEYLIRFLPDAVILIGKDKEDRGRVIYDFNEKNPPATDITHTWPDFYDEQGTMYAVYDFLERFCNVRWFNPTETGTDYHETKTLIVSGEDIRRKPAFCYRGAYANAMCENYDAYTALWQAGTEEFREYEELAYAELHKKFPSNYTHAKRRYVRLFLHRMRVGGEKCVANHSLYGYYDRFWEKNPNRPDVFVQKKPDWFAQGYEGTPPQLCYTNPELIKQVAQDARDYFDKGGFPQNAGPGLLPGFHWGKNCFAVEPMDNANFCKCQKCQKFLKVEEDTTFFSRGTHSDYMFNFVNEVAKELKKTHPDKYIVTLAYHTHAYPPETISLEPNIAVMFCFASNRLFYNWREYQHEIDILKKWVEKEKNRPLYLWLYYTFPVEVANNGKFHCFPGFFAHTIDKQFKLFYKLGIRGMYHCGYGQEVEAYVTYKLMDDPSLDVDKLLNEYFQRLYGLAGKPMKEIYLGIEETYSNPKNYPEEIARGKRSSHQTPEIAWDYLGTEARMEKLGKLLQKAKKLTRTELEEKRVALFEKAVWNYMVSGRKHYLRRKLAPIPAVTVACVESADGDLTKVNWTKASILGGSWFDRGTDNPSARKLTGRIAHDGKFLYLELTDYCQTEKLQSSATVFPYDTWEIFIAKQRARPYRQFAVGPGGKIRALSHGEVNWRQNVPIEGHGVKALSNFPSQKEWVTRLAIPLTNISAEGARPGEKIYLNVIRVSSPQLTGTGRLGIDTWVSFCTVHEVDRLAEITLSPTLP